MLPVSRTAEEIQVRYVQCVIVYRNRRRVVLKRSWLATSSWAQVLTMLLPPLVVQVPASSVHFLAASVLFFALVIAPLLVCFLRLHAVVTVRVRKSLWNCWYAR